MGVMYLRNDMQSLEKYCICAESFWPYNVYKFNVQPLPPAYADAPQRTIVGYAKLLNNQEYIQALNDNKPVVVGIEVFDSFFPDDVHMVDEDGVRTYNSRINNGLRLFSKYLRMM